MIKTLGAAIGPSLFFAQILLGVALAYYGTAVRKAFPIVFGSSLLLMACGHLLDVKNITGHEADILISLVVSLLFAFAILLVADAFKDPMFSVAIFLALLAGFYAVMNGVHTSTSLYEVFDAATSALVVLSLGFIVAIQSSKERPILATAIGAATLFYTGLNAGYYLDNYEHFQVVLNAATVVYATLIAGAYVLPNWHDTPPSMFAPVRVYKIIQSYAGDGLHALASSLEPLVRRD
jgi:hypothetical protein